jgi:hypothetical protein
MVKDQVFRETVEKTGYSEEKVEYLIKWFWKTINWYVRNPLATGKHIRVTNCFKIKLNVYRLGIVYRRYEIYLRDKAKRKLEVAAKLLYLTRVIKFINKHERQTCERIDNARRCQDKRVKTVKEKINNPGYKFDWGNTSSK